MKVLISIHKGKADIVAIPNGVEVEIRDFDNDPNVNDFTQEEIKQATVGSSKKICIFDPQIEGNEGIIYTKGAYLFPAKVFYPDGSVFYTWWIDTIEDKCFLKDKEIKPNYFAPSIKELYNQ